MERSGAMLRCVGTPETVPAEFGWQKRLTYVTTTRQATTGSGGMSLGTIIPAQRLQGTKVRCPRCDTVAATVWRRFDYFKLPLYFTKCRRCHRRRAIDADDAAFRLLEAGVIDPMAVLHQRTPAAAMGQDDPGAGESRAANGDSASVTAAAALVANRQRAYGRKHPLTFAARARLGEAVGKSGESSEAASMFEQLVADQVAAVGHQSPAVLANRYSGAVWTGYAGGISQALTALRELLVDQEKILGEDHVNSLITRTTIAQLLDQTGDREGAIEILRQAHQDQLRVLGSEHPATETTQRLLGEWDRP